MATIRLMRDEGEYADVPEGTADEAYLRKVGFKDLTEESLPEWPLKSTTPEEYIEQHGEDEDLSDAVAERLALARRIVGEAE